MDNSISVRLSLVSLFYTKPSMHLSFLLVLVCTDSDVKYFI